LQKSIEIFFNGILVWNFGWWLVGKPVLDFRPEGFGIGVVGRIR
jgi:hypothetical protein